MAHTRSVRPRAVPRDSTKIAENVLDSSLAISLLSPEKRRMTGIWDSLPVHKTTNIDLVTEVSEHRHCKLKELMNFT